MMSSGLHHRFMSDEFLEYDFGGSDGMDEQPLSWRLDPEESHSDWTIVVRHATASSCGQQQRQDTYHVHKNILAVGPWRSDYFVGLFRSSTHLAEAQDNTSRITLEDVAATAMPLVLDFLYDPHHQIVVSTEHAVALRYLSKYFGMRLLYKRVMEQLRDDMNLNNLGVYISNARLFHDETVLSLAASKCVDSLADIQETLLESIDPAFLVRILSNPHIDTCSASYQLSKLIATYCQIHRETINMETFLQLTDRKYIPLIDREAALPLLEIEAHLKEKAENNMESDGVAGAFNENVEGDDGDYNLKTEDSKQSSGKNEDFTVSTNASVAASLPLPDLKKIASEGKNDLVEVGLRVEDMLARLDRKDSSCLQKRCIHRLALFWREFADPSEMPTSILEKLSPSVLVSLLQQTSQVAKQTYEEVKEDWQKDVVKFRRDQENIMCGAIESEIHLKQQAESIQREANEKISHLRSLLAEKDRQIREYQTEWDKLVRVPAEYAFADETLSTYHHMSGKEPFDHKRNHRVNRFGRVRPTSMPRIGGSSENGYLVVESDGNNSFKRWPVFYYKGE